MPENVPKSVLIGGTRYSVGGRLYRRNSFGQDFYGTIVSVFLGSATARPCLFVRRDEQQSGSPFNVESVHPDDYIRTRYWSPEEVREAHEGETTVQA